LIRHRDVRKVIVIYRSECRRCARWAVVIRALDWLQRVELVAVRGSTGDSAPPIGGIIVLETTPGQDRRVSDKRALYAVVPAFWPMWLATTIGRKWQKPPG
jgi:predicted DCC family thiol-disulfide oxidoreductase YuxK